MKKFNFWKIELKFWKKKKNLKQKKLMIWMEQCSRRKCLLLHGVVETNAECTDDIIVKTCAEELGINVELENLDRSHRLGKVKRNDNEPQPIIVKFACYAVENKVFSNKKKLKGKYY